MMHWQAKAGRKEGAGYVEETTTPASAQGIEKGKVEKVRVVETRAEEEVMEEVDIKEEERGMVKIRETREEEKEDRKEDASYVVATTTKRIARGMEEEDR